MPDALETLLTPSVSSDALPGGRRLIHEIRRSPATPLIRAALQAAAPDLSALPATTYTLFREFEHTGERDGYQPVYFAKRSILTRAVFEMLVDEPGADRGELVDAVHDALWGICEETTWLLPAHEEQGPDYWDLKLSPRQQPLGAHTALTREPDSIDLFAAETGASLAEAVHLVGDRLAPEVVQRVRQEVQRRIFRPYLAYGRRHWWYKGALNWNGVCNGSIGLAFMRLERDPRTLAEAMAQVLEGFEAYIATGFEADGGSIEGIGYWNYGLMYYVALAELLRERTGGKIDLLAAPRMTDIARYPLAAALSPDIWVNFGDATEQTTLAPGIVSRLADRTGVQALRGLLRPDAIRAAGAAPAAKLAIVVRDAAWWDGAAHPFPAETRADVHLPDSGVVRLVGEVADGRLVALAAKAGHNDGHHSHTDVAHFIVHLDGESLLCDPGRGLYSKEYFREPRYTNVFCNSYGHSVPRIAGRMQQPGPEFGGHEQYRGEFVARGQDGDVRFVVIDFHRAYDVPGLTLARRTLRLGPAGEVLLEDCFAFDGAAQEIEEAFVTWADVRTDGARAHITGKRAALMLQVVEPAGAVFSAERLEEACRANRRDGVLTRLAVLLPPGSTSFKARIIPTLGL
jgi:hypothetical protein